MSHGSSKVELGVLVAVPSFIATPQTAVVLIDTADVTATAGVQTAPPLPGLVQHWANQYELLDAATQGPRCCSRGRTWPLWSALSFASASRRKWDESVGSVICP
jgi:hypothetical protein